MRILLIPAHVPAHMMEMVPLAWAFRCAGHDVLVAGPPDVVPVAHGAGLNAAAVGDPVDMIESGRAFMTADLFPAEELGHRDTDAGRFMWEQCAVAFVPHALAHADDYLSLAGAWRPDIVVADSMAPAGWVVAAATPALGVHVHCGVMPLRGPFEEKAGELLAPLCESLGITSLAPDERIDPCPGTVQAADAPPGSPMRYVPYNGSGSPPWPRTPGRRRVCLTFGSVLTWTGPRPFRTLLAALTDLPGTELVVTLSAASLRIVGDITGQVRVAEALPLNLLLADCDLIAHHGGTGTGLTALAYGVPQLLMPQWGNQFDYARRVADTGAGVTFSGRAEQADPAAVRREAERILTDPSFSAASSRLRTEMESAPDPARIVTELTARAAARASR